MELSRRAQILRKELESLGVEISHTKLLDIVSKVEGFKSYKDSKIKDYDVHFGGTIKFEGFTSPWGVSVKAGCETDALKKVDEMLEDCNLYLIKHGGYESPIEVENAEWFIGITDFDIEERNLKALAAMELEK